MNLIPKTFTANLMEMNSTTGCKMTFCDVLICQK